MARMSGTLVEGNAVQDDRMPVPAGTAVFSLVRADPQPSGPYARGILFLFDPDTIRIEWIEGWEQRAFQVLSTSSVYIFALEGEDPRVPSVVDAALRHSGHAVWTA